LSDEDVVFDPYAADGVEFGEEVSVNVASVLRGLEVDFIEGVAGEITLWREIC
jgi:hypothetical protein